MQASDSGSSAARITPQSSLEDARRLLFAPEVAAATTSDEILIASEIAQAQGDLEFAVDCMEILLAREPDDLRWRHRHAEFLVRSGELAAAEKSCLTSISADVRFHHAHRLLVHVRVLQGNLEGALIAAQTQETSCGSTFDSGYAIAQLLYRLERLDGALEAIHRINDRGPPTEASLLLNFEIAYRLSIQHEAQAVAERAVRLWPEASAPLAKLGHLLCDARSYTEAARTLQRARQADPQNVSLAHLHAIALRGAGDYRAALEAATFALSKDPDNCEYLYVVATVHDRLGERKRALACLRQALEIEPRRVSLHVALAHMLGNGGELDAAIQQLDVARTLVPDNASIRDLRLSFLAQRPRGFSIDRMAEANVTAARPIAPMPRARHRGTSDDAGTMARRLRIQMRVIVTLVLRDFRHRAVHSRFAIFAVFLPQALQIVTLGVVLSLFNHGRPPVGDHLFFFYATGVMPF